MRTILPLLLLTLAACSQTETPSEPAPPAAATAPTPSVDEGVTRAAAVARAVAQNPDDVDKALAEQGLTAAELEALMYEIASDPARSAAYEAARK